MTSQNILVIVAHSDDQIFGPGGTLATYANQGKNIHTIIFSYGQLSHPHFKKEVITKLRVKEAKQADDFLGGKGVTFLGIKEGHFLDKTNFFSSKQKLQDIFLHLNPEKIFTHSLSESHPDHKAVREIVLRAYDDLNTKGLFKSSVYTFGLYGLRFKNIQKPKLVVDITDVFFKKNTAMKIFKSQKLTLFWLRWIIYWRAFFSGLRNKVRFAEEFIKER
jgi:N-acetylglucosamine malate deacetylase 2